jgi:hypothetical protein
MQTSLLWGCPTDDATEIYFCLVLYMRGSGERQVRAVTVFVIASEAKQSPFVAVTQGRSLAIASSLRRSK